MCTANVQSRGTDSCAISAFVPLASTCSGEECLIGDCKEQARFPPKQRPNLTGGLEAKTRDELTSSLRFPMG